MGRGWPGQANEAAGSPRIHVHAPRSDHGPILAKGCGEFPVVAAARIGIAASRPRSVFVDEGDLGSSDRSLQWRSACARVVHLADGDAAGCEYTKPDQH